MRPVLLVLLGLALFSLVQSHVPVTAYRREIIINAPQQIVWDHFARVREWPSWMPSITSIELAPGDVTGPDTVATLTTGGVQTTFTMEEFDPPTHWMWTARMLWFALLYDHVFERIDDRQTRLVLHMQVTGMGKTLFGRLLDAASRAEHAKGLPVLAKEIESLPAASSSQMTPAASP